ncbi:MAG: response regulator [Deltaproteobacteria bacterium]|nr:response regulator [Deltaproteobacteria bacterium]
MRNVLVVDSDQVILRTLTSLLKNQGGFLDVFAATNTRQAIDLLQKTPVDLVITAIRLPKVDGFRLVSRLTKDYPSIKVIIMTRNAHPLLRASIKRFPSAVHLDQSHDISMLTKRVFTELQIDYGGGVRGINLSSFLQMMELESCTCSLNVTSRDMVGSLWLKNGELIAATSQAAEGEEAALDILAWRNVFIDIDYTPHEVERQISVPLMILMVESSQHYDEIKSNSKNNRAHERHDLLVALDYDIRNMTRQCFLRDISLGGAYIETEQEMEMGQTITLVLTSPKLKSSCSIEAHVVHIDGKGAGFRFQINSPEQQQIIKAMIDSSIKSLNRQEQEELSPSPVV